MKKGIRTLFSTLLISALVLTSAGTAFAGTSETKAADMTGSETKKVMETAKTDPAVLFKTKFDWNKKKNASAKAAEGDIPLTTIKADTSSLEVGTVVFDKGDVLAGSTKQGYSKAIPLPAKGTIIIQIAAQASASTDRLYFGLYRDAALSESVYSSFIDVTTNPPTDSKTEVIQVPQKGTYYLGVYSRISDDNQAYLVGAAAGYANGADRTIKSGAEIAVGQKNAQTNYFKIKTGNTGYITVASDRDSNYVTLCNSKKKALSGKTSARYAPTYGVKKGITYYVKVDSSYTSTKGFYTLRATNKKVTEKSSSTKAKAVTLKKGAKKSGTIIAGDKTADWYKFKLTSKKGVKITLKGKTNDTISVDVYGSRGKIGTRSFHHYSEGMELKSAGKWPKGTYYVKIYRGNSKSSGHYSVTWK